jgi:hypothetical protein
LDICAEAREIVDAANRERLSNFGQILRRCESPVEQMMLAALFDRWTPSINLHLNRIQCHLSAEYPPWDGIFIVCAEPQRTIATLLGATYRADIYIYITRFRHHMSEAGEDPAPELGRLVVEIDGHDYHERTKEQASYDKKRERELLLEGYRVIRFTGSDVYKDAAKCAEDVVYQVNELASAILKDYIERGRLKELIVGWQE